MNFARKMQRVSRRAYRHGEMDERTYNHVMEALKDPDVVEEWQAKVETQMNAPWKVSQGRIDWNTIWEWLKANWPTILRILLSILPLLILDTNTQAYETEE